MAGLVPAIYVFDPIKLETAGESPPFFYTWAQGGYE
jgi:hypothetical protein